MKTVILYRSKHHGNTKKLVDAVVANFDNVDAIDVAALGKNEYPDLDEYPLVGIATGIYYGKIDDDLARVMEHTINEGQKIFGLITYGGSSKWYGKDIDGICRMKRAVFLACWGCAGFDTWGPYKFMGGMNKGRPNQDDIQACLEFYKKLLDDYGDILDEQYEQYKKRRAYQEAHPAGGLMSNIKRSAKKITGKSKKPAAQASRREASSADEADSKADSE